MTYKLIALDLDGTLNNDQKVITPKTREALIKAQQQGAVVVLASGRPTSGLFREAKELHLDQYHGILLSYNGGKVIEVTTNNVLLEKAIPCNLAKTLLQHLESFDVTPIIDNGQFIYTNDPKGFQIAYESINNHLSLKIVDRIADAVDFDPVKILIASPHEKLVSASKKIIEPFKDELFFIFSAPFYLEATMKGIDKAKSLSSICEQLHILPEEVIAFGDAENDKSMLMFAGCGVAMGNATDELKAIADEVTRSNNDDGIAYTLAKYFKEIK